jgi:hypothetical protein
MHVIVGLHALVLVLLQWLAFLAEILAANCYCGRVPGCAPAVAPSPSTAEGATIQFAKSYPKEGNTYLHVST